MRHRPLLLYLSSRVTHSFICQVCSCYRVCLGLTKRIHPFLLEIRGQFALYLTALRVSNVGLPQESE